MEDIYKMGQAYDMPSAPVDGMSCEKVHDAFEEAVKRARKGEGPTFLEIRTYRYRGHSMSDPAKYRTKEEVEGYKGKDPIEVTKATLLKNKWAKESDLEKIEDEVMAVVDESVKFAEESEYPDPMDLYKDVYQDSEYPFIIE